jgi:hypothetical protein
MTRPISSRSLFRPASPVDQSVLVENRKLIEQIDRRSLMRGTISLGALSLLTGCNVTDRSAVQSVLTAVSSWNDLVQDLALSQVFFGLLSILDIESHRIPFDNGRPLIA